MKTKDTRNSYWLSANRLRFFFNFLLVLLMLISTCGVALASSNLAPLRDEPVVSDPYDLWTDQYLDFIPPNPDPIEETQPDGAVITVFLTPMETGGQLETPEGYTIIQDDDGWWTFAQLDAAGQTVPSSLIVGRDLPQGLAKKIGQTPSRWLDDQGNDKRDAVFEAVKNVQSPNASIFAASDVIVKNYHYVVVLAEFQDVKFETFQTPQYFKDQISGLGTSPTGTVSDLYFEMSYGQFLPDFEVG